jgi:SHS2 domain-containing protein
MDYEFLDLTSDVMFRAYGMDEAELFINAAKAMFSVKCNIKSVPPKKSIEITSSGSNLEELLFDWLSTLLTQSEIEAMFFSEFRVDGITRSDGGELRLSGSAVGDGATVELGETDVKGVTYYGFKIEEKDDGFMATVSLDV